MKAESFQNLPSQMKRALFRPMAVGFVVTVLCMISALSCEASFLRAALGLEQRQRAIEKERRRREERREWEKKLLQEDRSAPARLDALMAERQVYLDGLLKPLFDSYAIGAKMLLDPFAEDVGLSVSDYTELPIRRLPIPTQTDQMQQLYARKPIRLTCTGSYATIVSFLLRVEENLPLVSLEAFSLKTQGAPDNQSATIVLEWPIKGEKDAVVKGGVKK